MIQKVVGGWGIALLTQSILTYPVYTTIIKCIGMFNKIHTETFSLQTFLQGTPARGYRIMGNPCSKGASASGKKAVAIIIKSSFS
jgi:hypothetical protein